MTTADPHPERPQPAPAQPRHRRAAAWFTLGAVVVAAITIALLSLDWTLAREHNPQTDNAYVGGDSVPLAARVGGYLVALDVQDNQPVHAGDLVGRVEDADYRAQADQARAALAAAQAQVQAIAAQQNELAAQIGQAQTQETSQTTQTIRTGAELIRQQRLINTDVGVRRTLEQAQADQRQTEASAESARATVEVRRRQSDILSAQLRQAQATVAARQADVALADINLGWTRIVAPANGTIGPRRVRVGDLLQAGSVLATLTPLDTVWVDANFTERQIPDIRPGQPARLRLDAFPDQPLAGHVLGLSPLTGSQMAAIPADNSTGNFTKVVQRVSVRLAIDWNATPLRGLVRPGMSAVATVFTDRGA